MHLDLNFNEDSICPICMDGNSYSIGSYSDKLYGRHGCWELLRCSICMHESMYPIPSADFLESLYDAEEYYSFRTNKISRFVRWLRSKTRRLIPKNLNGKRFLDFGCGDAEVLNLAFNGGAEVYGIEFGEVANVLREETGFKILQNPPNDWNGTIDYVRSFHSLEHVANPKEVLEIFKRLVVPGTGEILIGVPNVDSWVASIFGRYYFYRGVPLHVHGFTPRSIVSLAKSVGLEVISIRTPGGFRGILGSIGIFFQHCFLGTSREPKLISFLILSPIYILILPLVLVGNVLLKGDVMEVRLRYLGE